LSRWVETESKRRRDRLYIIAEILEIAREGVLKTQVMYRANLSFSQLNEYLNLLVQIGLLEEIKRNGRKMYKTTRKGLNYLERYKEIVQLLNGSENDEKNGNSVKNIPLHVIKNVRYLR